MNNFAEFHRKTADKVKKIILITSEFYYPHIGGNLIIQKLAEGLVKRNYKVVVATTFLDIRNFNELNGVLIKSFKISGNQVKGFKGEVSEYQNFLKNNRFDILLNYAAQTWATDLTFPILDDIKAKKIFVPVGYSKLRHPHYQRYYKKLEDYLARYDHLVYLSNHYQDKIFGDQIGINRKIKWSVISNAADENEFLIFRETINFRKKFNINTPYLIVSVSNHDFAKNHFFLWRVVKKLKRNDYTLALIGRQQSLRSCKPFCFLASKFLKPLRIFDSLTRDEVIAALQSADLSILTSQIETDPLVMYESFASKTPFISTSVGSIPEFNDFVKIVSDPDQMALVIDYFLSDFNQRKIIAERAFQLWNNKFRLSQIVDAYDRVLKN